MRNDNRRRLFEFVDGSMPLVVALAEDVTDRAEADTGGTHYSTYTTQSGPRKDLDDAPVKDED